MMRLSFRNRSGLSALLLPLFFATPLLAQSASFQTFGSGCPGSANQLQSCANSNGKATSLQSLFFSSTSEVAIEVTAKLSSPVVLGFELLTRANIKKTSVKAHIYFADSKGQPLTTPAATGVLAADTKTAWYRVRFTKPLLVKPGQKFFLSWTDPKIPFSQEILWPVPSPATLPKTVSHHRSSSSSAWGKGFRVYPWAWRVLCPSSTPAVPTLKNRGLPKLGSSYNVDLSNALAANAAALLSGFSTSSWGALRLPFDLGLFGAKGCSILCSIDLLNPVRTDAAGDATVAIPVPANKALIGLKLHHQWMVLDARANSLGFAFSGAGTATLGN